MFGNAENKIPKHSLFGQSYGDLDSYKYGRDSAYEDVQAAQSKIRDIKKDQLKIHHALSDIKREIKETFAEINLVKDARSKMFELKKSGYKRKELQNAT